MRSRNQSDRLMSKIKCRLFFGHDAAPMRVGKIQLKVRGLDAVSGFYRNVLGLTVMANDDRGATSARATSW